LDSPKGCLLARSLSIGGTKMKLSNIDRYKTFGLRSEWIKLFFELKNNFWKNDRMGQPMFVGFKAWAREAGLLDNNSFSLLAEKLSLLGCYDLKVWGVILNNIAYKLGYY
jgi:hypothetical protein